MSLFEPILADVSALLPPGAWALCGGLAVSARSEPRFTRDVDIVVALADDAAADACVRSFGARGYRPETLIQQEAKGRLAAARLVSAVASGPVLDLLFASSGIEAEVAAVAERIELLPGVVVPVARLGHLLALKVLSVNERRPQDRADLDALVAHASDADVALARGAVALMMERSYSRGRDLKAGLEDLVRSRRP